MPVKTSPLLLKMSMTHLVIGIDKSKSSFEIETHKTVH